MTRCLILSLTGLLVIAPLNVQADKTLIKLSNVTLPPVTMSSHDGFLDRIAEVMFDRAGLSFELLKLPPARGLALSNAGLLDGELARIDIRTDLFPNLQKLPEPLIDVLFAGLYLRADINVSTQDDFRHYRVGYIRGWVIAETLFADNENATATGSIRQWIDMLEADRIDIAFMTVAPARYLANSRGMDKLKITGFRVNKDLYLYLHEKHAGKMPTLSRALKSMKEDGTHQAILREYRLEYQ